eukprot:3588531-Pyramimonas_sp.AAC.1
MGQTSGEQAPILLPVPRRHGWLRRNMPITSLPGRRLWSSGTGTFLTPWDGVGVGCGLGAGR